MPGTLRYKSSLHAAARTSDFVFNQLIPYIGNKRKLLDLIADAVAVTRPRPGDTFLDLFAGSGVVSRFAKKLGLTVIANDWEPHTRPINACYIECNHKPSFARLGGYETTISLLNSVSPRVDWVTENLAPLDDDHYDVATERMFFMRKNATRIDAIRGRIEEWHGSGMIDAREANCLLAPLLYQACYRSNTSGVFKGFHRGWGGQTRTALHRIATDLVLSPAVFHDNGRINRVLCKDAAAVARDLSSEPVHIAYIDPPYNQHPYASNYHVLTSIALWDRPALPPPGTRGSKSAIRTDWRTTRRSPYNHRGHALDAYRDLVAALNARYILTSYSTDGTIPLDGLLAANTARGRVTIFARPYKRYRVSTQRYSPRPTTIEFVILVDTARSNTVPLERLRTQLEIHPGEPISAGIV